MSNQGWETKVIENQASLKNFNLNLILTSNTYIILYFKHIHVQVFIKVLEFQDLLLILLLTLVF